MTEREKILGRVREALAVKTPLDARDVDPGAPSTGRAREWLPGGWRYN